MPSRLYRVDMSEGSRDFAAVATEPGLAMLDSQGVNYSILYKWLGRLVAEPELQGPQLVAFYVREEERGRLENVTCAPATKKDLEGPLKDELEEIRTRLRKAKPESATEQLLHRIVSRSFNELTENLETSDFHCYFFKYRAGGGPWRLVWCWGYQRKDMEPSRAVICTNMDCHQLFAHTPKTKRRCPACATVPVKRQRGAMAVLNPKYLLLLLLLALGLFLYFNQPRLVITPATWSGPRGSRVDFQVVDQRWYFFRDDVSGKTVPQSHDTHVMQFARGVQGKAKGEGQTFVTFRFGSRNADVTVQVGPPIPPNSITIEPEDLIVAVDSTERLRVIGHYDKDVTLDLTDDATFEIAETDLAYVSQDRLHGVAPGKTKLTVRYQATEKDKVQELDVDVEVTEIAYASLNVSIDPSELAIGQTGELTVVGVTDDGREFDLMGSTKLDLIIEPVTAVKLEDAYVTGQTAGKAKVTAKLGELSKSFEFTVGGSLLAADTFEVQPSELTIPAASYRDLDVVTAESGEVTTESSDSEVAEVHSPDPFLHRLNAKKEGSTTITFRHGGQERTVLVTVVPNTIQSVRIEPAVITAYVGEPTSVAVVGVQADGSTMPLAPEQFDVIQQPRTDYADFDRVGLTVFGVRETPIDDKLVVSYGDFPAAEATVRVVKRTGSSGADVDVWLPYPPVDVAAAGFVPGSPVAIGGGRLIGDGLIYDPNRGLIVGDTIPAGLVGTGIRAGDVIGTIGGRDITGIRDPALLERYLGGLGLGDAIGVVGPGGALTDIVVGKIRGFEQVQLNYAKETNVTPTDFSAELNLQFRRAGQYRVTDAGGNELSPWQSFEAGSAGTIMTSPIPRVAGQTEYDIYVERQSGDTITKFPFSLALDAGN